MAGGFLWDVRANWRSLERVAAVRGVGDEMSIRQSGRLLFSLIVAIKAVSAKYSKTLWRRQGLLMLWGGKGRKKERVFDDFSQNHLGSQGVSRRIEVMFSRFEFEFGWV